MSTINPHGKEIISVSTELAGKTLTHEVNRVGFRTTSSVLVKYGDTVVLGGVAADATSSILDKIPVLGDLPFVGRLFQSHYTNAEKRNLLVFLTCKLVKPDGTPFFPQENRNRGVPEFGQNYF